MKWIDRIPLVVLVVIAALLAVAPMHEEAHLLAKTKMLLNMTLVKPIDIFDLFMHGTPLLLLVIRLIRMVMPPQQTRED